jgi:hypothetical protein
MEGLLVKIRAFDYFYRFVWGRADTKTWARED